MARYPLSPPFAASSSITVVLPTHVAHLPESEQHLLTNIPRIFTENRNALARELGAPLELSTSEPSAGVRWLIGPGSCNPALTALRPAANHPELFLDRSRQLLITDAPTPAEVWETFSWLRSLARFPGGTLQVADCRDIGTGIDRVEAEVGDSYPSFRLRGLDWASLCTTYRDYVRHAPNPIHALQEWLAELHDTHTWVRPATPMGELPYEVWLTEDAAIVTRVPHDTVAWDAGVRPGFRILGQDLPAWWRRTAATPHARPLMAGRRLMSGPIGAHQEWIAESPQGVQVRWSEPMPATRWESLVTWSRLPSKTGYLRINAWRDGSALEAAIDTAFADFRATPRLIVDLRGNGGGDLVLAQRFRNRFLRQASVLGSIQYSVTHKVLSEPEVVYGEPAPAGKRWAGRVRFLTDPLTYSASEDVLLGLQGLDHVEVIGEPSGGGSGRMRMLRLVPGWWLTVSTALTYDREGRCVENVGIPVDRKVVPDRFAASQEDLVLQIADQDW